MKCVRMGVVCCSLVACVDRDERGASETSSEPSTGGSGGVNSSATTDGSQGSGASDLTSVDGTSAHFDMGVTGGQDTDGDDCTVDGCAPQLGECEACCPSGEDVPTVSDGTCSDAMLAGEWACVLERMRDGTQVRLEFTLVSAVGVAPAEPCTYNHFVALLGDGTALHMSSNLRETLVSEVRHVQVRPSEYFTDCLNETDEADIARCFADWFVDGEICEPFDCCGDPSTTWCE